MPGAPLLSAPMIVRDEERFLGDCLASLRGLVDDLVIVDTGSVDGTVAIAESYGARGRTGAPRRSSGARAEAAASGIGQEKKDDGITGLHLGDANHDPFPPEP